MRGVVVLDWDDGGVEGEWLTKHASGGLHITADYVPEALRHLADMLETNEARRAGLPE